MTKPRPDALTHAERGSLGGAARAAALTDDERAATARSGAAATNSAASLARRIAKAWPKLSRAEQKEVRDILAARGIVLRRPPGSAKPKPPAT